MAVSGFGVRLIDEGENAFARASNAGYDTGQNVLLNSRRPMVTTVNSVEGCNATDYLLAALGNHSKVEIARFLGVNTKTVRRWELRESEPPAYVAHALQQMLPFQFPIEEANAPVFRFIDLFAGIGGNRLAFEGVGGKCVFTSEWDEYAQKTYAANFASDHVLAGDITKISAEAIPEHDVLLAGFPCQPFSIAGVSKKNALGRKHGFADETQGTLFFDIARIIKAKQPRAFLLENVKNLKSHDQGRTFEIIRRTLQDELGYQIHIRVVDGAHFVPQHRERVLIAGFREPSGFDWNALRLPPKNHVMRDVLHKTDGSEPFLQWDTDIYFSAEKKCVNPKYTLTPRLWAYLQTYREKHQAQGNGFGFGLVGPESVARTLSARYYKDGSEILVSQRRGQNPRRLTPRECARLMGFPDSFKIPVSDTRAYKQFGNSVVVPVMQGAATLMKQFLTEESLRQPELQMAAA